MKNDKETLDQTFAGESRESQDEIDFQDRLDRYRVVKTRSLEISDYLKQEPGVKKYPGLHNRIATCGNLLQFRNYHEVKKIMLIRAQFCETHLLCPFCALRRGSKYARMYSDKLASVIGQFPDLNLSLVTLTVKNGPDLRERFSHIESSITKLINQRRMALNGRWKNDLPELTKALGGVFSFEIKRGQGSGEWHPHIHALILHEGVLDEKRLSLDWKAVTGDSFQVDVTPAHGSDYAKAGLEVFAYALKFSTMEEQDLFHAFKIVRGKRFVRSFGCLRGVAAPESLLDDLIHDQPYYDMLYQYTSEHGYLLKRLDTKIIPEKIGE